MLRIIVLTALLALGACAHKVTKDNALADTNIIDAGQDMSLITTPTKPIIKAPTKQVEAPTAPAEPSFTSILDPMQLYYIASWKGITVGEFSLDIKQATASNFDVFATMKARGLLWQFTKYQSKTHSRISEKPHEFIQRSYDHNTQDRRKKRNIKVGYRGKNVLSAVVTPAEKSWKRPKVADSKRDGTYNPISMLFTGWKKLVNELESGAPLKPMHFSLLAFDGRRLAKTNFEVKPANKKGLIPVWMSLEPVDGFSDKEMKNFAERKYYVKAYLSPTSYLPVKIVGESALGNVYIKLKKTCSATEVCKKS